MRLLHRKEGKDVVFSSKVKCEVEKDYWKLHGTKSRNPEIQNKQVEVNDKLKPVSDYILEEFKKIKIELIPKDWLKEQIFNFYNPIEEIQQSDLLVDAIQSIIDEAPTRKNAKGGIGLSTSRVNAYNSLKNMLTEYQKQNTFKVKDVNVKFGKNFLK